MARDVKHRIPAFRPRKRKTSNRALILGGLAIGLIVIGSALFSLRPQKEAPTPTPASAAREEPSSPRFAYFRVLEDRESQIPESLLNEEERNQRVGKPSVSGAFSLLIGAYKSREEASLVRNRLSATDALKPHLEEVTLEFASWYRIKLGPYSTLRDANQVRLFLKGQGTDSIILTTEAP
jgi:cell division protein FtsN